jgi:hypothetical protein
MASTQQAQADIPNANIGVLDAIVLPTENA